MTSTTSGLTTRTPAVHLSEFDGDPLPEKHVIAATAFQFPQCTPRVGSGELDIILERSIEITDRETAHKAAEEIVNQLIEHAGLDTEYENGETRELADRFVRMLTTQTRIHREQDEARHREIIAEQKAHWDAHVAQRWTW